jgi:ATP-dependent Clp protease ATP-binding subunit ClpA
MRAPPISPSPVIGFTRNKRTGDDSEAINRLFAPEFRNRLDAVIAFGHLSTEVIGNVVDKFVLQLEAQLADRQVTIELSPDAKDWLIERGYDEQMGARPMARVIQEYVKKPLAEDLLFGRLKGGGAVRVVVGEVNGKKALTFDFPAGPVTPKPEKDVAEATKAREKRSASAKKAAAARKAAKAVKKGGPDGAGGGGAGGKGPGGKPPVRTVPKMPLVKG